MTQTCTLITGASRRIGRAIAEACVQRGERVVAHRRNATPERHPLVPGAIDWVWDMDTQLIDVPDMPITHLVLNASRYERGVEWASMSREEQYAESELLQRHWQTNVMASWWLATALARAHPLESIVFVLDTYHDRPLPQHAAYQVSRAAGVGLVRALAVELAPTRVNAVAPGTVLASERAPRDRVEDEAMVAKRTLAGRPGSPSDVVDAVLYLRDAGYVSGEILRVDGGRFSPGSK